MNKKYKEFQGKIKEWKKQGYDKNLLQGLFNLSNPIDDDKVDYTNDLKQCTNYSSLTNKQFNSIFLNERFKKLDSEQLKNVFQELHNRYITSNGYEVSRNVVIGEDKNNWSTYGYVSPMNNMLFINKYAIDKEKNDDDELFLNNKNIGIGLYNIITHESQHICQFESAIDFANGVRKDPKNDFLAAMIIIEHTNASKVVEEKDIVYFSNYRENYDYQYTEHDANYKAFKKTKLSFGNDEKFMQDYKNYLGFAGYNSLRGLPFLSTQKFIDKRLDKMEKFVKYEVDYFNKNIKDCSLKEELIRTINKYMDSTNKSESNFRKDLKSEISEILNDTNLKDLTVEMS